MIYSSLGIAGFQSFGSASSSGSYRDFPASSFQTSFLQCLRTFYALLPALLPVLLVFPSPFIRLFIHSFNDVETSSVPRAAHVAFSLVKLVRCPNSRVPSAHRAPWACIRPTHARCLRRARTGTFVACVR